MGPLSRSVKTKLKMTLPVGKKRAWKLIGTTKGLESWFPTKCTGQIESGNYLELESRDGSTEKYRINYLGEKHSSFRLLREDGSEVRFYLHGRMTTLTLEVDYPDSVDGKEKRISELPLWAFRLANLKSVALRGPDLRHRLRGRTKFKGFID